MQSSSIQMPAFTRGWFFHYIWYTERICTYIRMCVHVWICVQASVCLSVRPSVCPGMDVDIHASSHSNYVSLFAVMTLCLIVQPPNALNHINFFTRDRSIVRIAIGINVYFEMRFKISVLGWPYYKWIRSCLEYVLQIYFYWYQLAVTWVHTYIRHHMVPLSYNESNEQGYSINIRHNSSGADWLPITMTS